MSDVHRGCREESRTLVERIHKAIELVVDYHKKYHDGPIEICLKCSPLMGALEGRR